MMIYTPSKMVPWTRINHYLFYDAVEYVKNVCFKELGETIADARRAGDAHKSMEIIAETMKLIGNSLYGSGTTICLNFA
jgi:hypothetical protein